MAPFRRFSLLAVLACLAGTVWQPVLAEQLRKPPTGDLAAIVSQSLAAQGVAAGDVVSQSQVQKAFATAEGKGFKIPEKDTILGLVLPDSHTLVRLARSEGGREFVRKVGGYSEGYDRIDRLTKLHGGDTLVREIAAKPRGHELLQPLPAGSLKCPTRLLPRNQSGKTPTDPHFDQPTGKLYTHDQLLARLREAAKSGK